MRCHEVFILKSTQEEAYPAGQIFTGKEKKSDLDCFDFHLAAKVRRCYMPPDLHLSLGRREATTAQALKAPPIAINKEQALRGSPQQR